MRRTAFITLKFCLSIWLVLLWPAPGRADFANAVVDYDNGRFSLARGALNGLALQGHAGAADWSEFGGVSDIYLQNSWSILGGVFT